MGIVIVKGMAPLKDSFEILGSIAVMLAGGILAVIVAMILLRGKRDNRQKI